MFDVIPHFISFIFEITTILTLLLFTWVIKNAQVQIFRNQTVIIFIGLIIWLAVQAFLALHGVYYENIQALPPKIILLGIFPVILLFVLLFTTKKGTAFIDSLPLQPITYLNIVRIPVEIVLYFLYLAEAVPQLMTFEGRNFDILAGITAPFIAYFTFTNKKISNKGLLIWNIICLGLLINIVVNAILSAPGPLQQFAFNQPNVAILQHPFSWLPTFVVPIVLLGHLVSIRRLWKES